MELKQLCELIGMPEEMTSQIYAFVSEYDVASLDSLIEELRKPETAFSATAALQEKFADAVPANIPLLFCMLTASARNYPVYRQKGISDEIYIATMKAFTRFCKEQHKKTGFWHFDRSGWVSRQASMRLFRIGILEYEFMIRNGEPMISIHIPSDTVFTEENLDHTFSAAKAFVETYYPEHKGDRFFCDSWLMAPKLQELLPEDSGIVRFQKRFASIEETPFPDACVGWVFGKTAETPISELPENTSLQRKIKALMLEGGHLNAGLGLLDK